MKNFKLKRGLRLSVLLMLFIAGPLFAVQAPPWTLTNGAGETVSYPEVAQEQTHIILFWASWCPYCKALMPHLQSIIEEHGYDRVKVFAINIKDDEDPRVFMSKTGYEFTLLLDGDEVAERYGVKGTPGLAIVDGDGEIVFNIYDHSDIPPRAADGDRKLSHRQKAGRRAPFWAARIREALDQQFSTLANNP